MRRGLDASTLYAPDDFPQILRAQIDLMVQAMACGMTRVGVIQASHHTSELIMSRFMNTPMYDPGFDMRSHQASHYGAAHDPTHREYRAFAQQVKWWVEQFAYLLAQLAARPEGQRHDARPLARAAVHRDLPTATRTSTTTCRSCSRAAARARSAPGASWTSAIAGTATLLVAIANAMGDNLTYFGDASAGALPGLLT